MTATRDAGTPEPIEFGDGKLELEAFLEPTCPYSKRAFGKLRPLLAEIGPDALTLKVRFISQPWHLFSGVITRCILAASATEGGKEAAWKAMGAVYEHREEFEAEDHSSGPYLNLSPNTVIGNISQLIGIDLNDAFRLPGVDRALRWHVKYGRQNGVHVSPSFAINGLLEPAMSSGQTVEEWSALLRPYMASQS